MGETEVLKDSNRSTEKVFHDLTSAEAFVNKINTYTHSNKKWYVVDKKTIR